MTKLADKHCVPCRGGTPPLQGPELIPFAEQLPDWKIIEKHHIAKSFRFPDFKAGLDFVNRVGAVAEAEGHHPDLCLAWGKVDVQIYTHKISRAHCERFCASREDRPGLLTRLISDRRIPRAAPSRHPGQGVGAATPAIAVR